MAFKHAFPLFSAKGHFVFFTHLHTLVTVCSVSAFQSTVTPRLYMLSWGHNFCTPVTIVYGQARTRGLSADGHTVSPLRQGVTSTAHPDHTTHDVGRMYLRHSRRIQFHHHQDVVEHWHQYLNVLSFPKYYRSLRRATIRYTLHNIR